MGRFQACVTGGLVLIGAVAIGGGSAQAGELGCGDTITEDTTLTHNLVNCPSNGLVIGANGVTLDLNGHRIDGDGTEFAGCPDDEFCDVGLLNDGHARITVKHGSVRQFALGAFVGHARRQRLLDVTSSRNVFFGFVIVESKRSVVSKSSGVDNLVPEGDGIGVFGSDRIRIVNSLFRHNAGPGLHIGESGRTLVKGNRFSRSSDVGVLVEGSRNRIVGNRCAEMGTCVLVAVGDHNRISRNQISGGATGIGVEDSSGTVVAGNEVAGTSDKGIYLGLKHPPIGGGHNLVRRNRVRGSGGDAYVVREKDHHSVLRHNIAVGAGEDGFDVGSRTATLAGNRAFRNGDLGIETVRGLIDGGGNKAGGNGDPRQCKHIDCD